MIYLDTETCGFHGPIVLIQYAIDDGDVIMHSVWKHTFQETMNLIKEICNHEEGICGFNLAFDWFHICQLWTTMDACCRKFGCWDEVAEDCITEYAICESLGRDGPCLKPHTALDLMCHARKGPFQSLMDRKDIKIRRIPSLMAPLLAEELGRRIPLKDVYFAKYKNKKRRWTIHDIVDEDTGDVDPFFMDVMLKFKPAAGLKPLATETGIVSESRVLMEDFVERLPKPVELGYAPFATAIGSPEDWKGAWPDVIGMHIRQWTYNEQARDYAKEDVHDTRNLHRWFSAKDNGLSDKDATAAVKNWTVDGLLLIDLPPGDTDSLLTCMVGAVRWHGFSIDKERLKGLRAKCREIQNKAVGNFNSVDVARKYLHEVMDEIEKTVIGNTTKGPILEEIARWKGKIVCPACKGAGCHDCEDGFLESSEKHPAAVRAQEILDFRRAGKRIEVIQKLLLAGRFHVSVVVIGTRSSRMSGADDLNPQGVDHSEEFRSCFTLKSGDFVISGGDFAGFELTVMDAAYGDPRMHAELQSGPKLHALWGSRYFFPNKTIEEILASKGLAAEKDMYGRSKNGVFAVSYFGEGYTLHTRVGIPEDIADEAYNKILKDYPDFAEKRRDVINMFCSMSQPAGLGTEVVWKDPAEKVESLLGFPRYYTLENMICKALFDLAQKPPKPWKGIGGRIKRRDREQTFSGAVQSALYGAAFAIQGSNMRSAGNHRIQSTGAEITKVTEATVWEFQPVGINNWLVLPMNIHDEVITLTIRRLTKPIKEAVLNVVESYRPRIPLIKMEWCEEMASWAEK